MSAPRLLVVEDDPSILFGLRINLEGEGYVVATAEDGERGLALAQGEPWDLVVLDLMLPRMNGFEVVSTLRSSGDRTPVLILSARGAENDMIMGLDLGADDYVTKPFAVGELLARVRAALRRGGTGERRRYAFADVEVDVAAREVRRSGAVVDLTPTELDILIALIRADGRVLSRAQIMESVWGPDHFGTPRTVDNFIAQLRAKLGDDAVEPRHIVTARGIGYRFAA